MTDPRELSTEELTEMARRAGVKGTEHMTKAQMLRALGQAEPGPGWANAVGHYVRWSPPGNDLEQWRGVRGDQ